MLSQLNERWPYGNLLWGWKKSTVLFSVNRCGECMSVRLAFRRWRVSPSTRAWESNASSSGYSTR